MRPIETNEAPEAVGAYSQGVVQDQAIYTSGQIGLDPNTGQLIEESFEQEVRQALENLLSVVRAGGGSAESIVKTTVFLSDLSYYETLNAVYHSYFSDVLPARSVVEVASLPKNARVEIEAVAGFP